MEQVDARSSITVTRFPFSLQICTLQSVQQCITPQDRGPSPCIYCVISSCLFCGNIYHFNNKCSQSYIQVDAGLHGTLCNGLHGIATSNMLFLQLASRSPYIRNDWHVPSATISQHGPTSGKGAPFVIQFVPPRYCTRTSVTLIVLFHAHSQELRKLPLPCPLNLVYTKIGSNSVQ